MTEKQEALFFFRKLVYCIYREIGVFKPKHHPRLAEKAKLSSKFFSDDRKRQAGLFFHQTETQENTGLILKLYEDRTGLSLQDIHQIFAEGHWQCHNGRFSFGGPKWARITEKTLELRQAIVTEDWSKVPALLGEIKTLEHNNGLVVNKFKETESY